jgi:NADPH-dependent 2,4-dienoyl-CoA reductase/sulfur reductase-like enzyme
MIVIIGGGPAGLAAAHAIARSGQAARIIDAATHLGGQYWRGARPALLTTVMDDPSVTVSTGTSVWNVTADEHAVTIRTLKDGVEEEIRADRVVLATGAHDRSLPFPGWTLPGVMTAGGAQALLKGETLPFARRVVVAGSGPFLLPVAAGLVEAGVEVVEVCEAASPFRWSAHPRAMLGNPARVLEATRYLATLRRAGTRVTYGSRVIAAHGHQRVAAVEIRDRSGRLRSQDIDGLAIGWGFTPDLSVAQGIGLVPRLVDGTLVIPVDARQETERPGVFAAGEITGIGGMRLSLIEGEIAGLAAVGEAIPWRLRERRAHHRSFARALAQVYPVDDSWRDHLRDDTVICRCEEVDLRQIRSAIHDLGASDTRSLKLLARTGMGMCQGRICGQAVAGIVAAECDRSVEISDLLAHRPVITPIPLGTLAAFREEHE